VAFSSPLFSMLSSYILQFGENRSQKTQKLYVLRERLRFFKVL
jgi:hypothetical protein